MNYAHYTTDSKQPSLIRKMGQVPQYRLNRTHRQNVALGLDNDDGRIPDRIASLAGSVAVTSSRATNVARTLPVVPVYPTTLCTMDGLGPHSSPQTSVYNSEVEIMGLSGIRAGISQHDKNMSVLRDFQHSNLLEHNPFIHPSCRICGQLGFSNRLELLVHENSCCVNIPLQQPRSSNDTLGIHQSIIQPTYHDEVPNMREYIKICTPNVSSSLHIRSSIGASGYSRQAVLPLQSFNPIPPDMPSAKENITPLQSFVDHYCMEFFTVSTSDIFNYSSEAKWRHIHTGQIGIRCPYCQKGNHSISPETSTISRMNNDCMSFPIVIASIYSATLELLEDHMHICKYVPPTIMKRYNELKTDDTSYAISRQYWIESANAMGFVDTTHGIQSSRRAYPSVKNYTYCKGVFPSDSNALAPATVQDSNMMVRRPDALYSIINDKSICFSDIEAGPLVDSKFKHLTTKYSYTLMSQMEACATVESDQRNKRVYHPLGFAGLSCRYCCGENGRSRFFPANIKTMSDTSKTLNVLHNHILRCKQCPLRVKVGLQNLRLRHDEERSKMKHGSQKAFFVSIWNRLHGRMPLDSNTVSHH